MARPPKIAEERRENRTVRYTTAEWLMLAERGAEAGLSTSEYVRAASLSARVVKVVRSGGCDPAVVSELNQLSLQLSALGNLANQVALYLHTGRPIPKDWSALPGAIEKTRREASALLCKLVEQK
ncbi:plasmid mobilization protein [Botrimarina mediterranea]|uniref:Bacterial mobilisation domain-containing protein n=1 Tax=Botrimarina mediterranea TaxID=2528022 RepID=A0A518K244_9BACT|nr:hypothetical protein [Botrimarina mediterranea]QDV71884.1 hypothetical protein Spa11_00530 [Botrimarina mediterranea]